MTDSTSSENTDSVISNGALIAKLHLIEDEKAKGQLIDGLFKADQPTVVSFLNAHALTMADKNQRFRSALHSSDYLLRDGIGVSLLLRSLGLNPGYNMNGTDFIPEVIESFSATKIAFYGTQDPWLCGAAEAFREKGAKVISTIDGFDETQTYIEDARNTKPRLIVLAMGMPRQEEVAMELKSTLSFPVVIINGGAILDFISGRFSRAPNFLRLAGLEWFYRLIKEPKRLARRYLLGIFTFGASAIRVILQRRKI